MTTFIRLTPDSTAEVVDFSLRHGDELTRERVRDPKLVANLFNGRSIYGGRQDGGELTAIVTVAERDHLTSEKRLYFPYVIAPDLTPETRRRILSGFLACWRTEEAPHERRMIIYDETPDGDDERFLEAEGFTFVRRHIKHARDLAGDLPSADAFPRVAKALERGYSVSFPTAADLEADAALVERIVTMRNESFSVRDNIDCWTHAEMMRQMNLTGAAMILLWSADDPVGLGLWFLIGEGEDKGDAYVSEIVVERRHWGTGAADLMGLEMLRATQRQGALLITGTADETNYPSRRLMERFGLQVRKISASWALEVPSSAPR